MVAKAFDRSQSVWRKSALEDSCRPSRNQVLWKMDKPLRQHITELERRVQQLSQEMMLNKKTRMERNRLESELRVAQQALEHFQQAVKLEAQLQRS